ncbi:hypothetical protein Tco_0618067 [Tanacetum coccineum]
MSSLRSTSGGMNSDAVLQSTHGSSEAWMSRTLFSATIIGERLSLTPSGGGVVVGCRCKTQSVLNLLCLHRKRNKVQPAVYLTEFGQAMCSSSILLRSPPFSTSSIIRRSPSSSASSPSISSDSHWDHPHSPPRGSEASTYT